MTRVKRVLFVWRARLLAMALVVAWTPVGFSSDAAEDILHFAVTEGKIYNEFYRSGPVAAHTVLRSGRRPRLIVAFPAGNSGVSLWFDTTEEQVAWQALEDLTPLSINSPSGPLNGIEATVSVRADTLVVRKVVQGNIRTIRTYMHESVVDNRIQVSRTSGVDTVRWSRVRLDGSGGYQMGLTMLSGKIAEVEGKLRLDAGTDGMIRFRMQALTGDTPLTPIPMQDLLTDEAALDRLSRNILAFLTYEEKMLAGSWRFNTYFGRDTLLSAALLMPVLKPKAFEAAATSVLSRLAADGQVAHEEDIAEFAVLRQLDRGNEAVARPIYDYAMVDEDFMLTPVLARYLSMGEKEHAHLKALLAQQATMDETYADLLMRNVRYVLKCAQPFAQDPVFHTLIEIEEGSRVGDWRDSQEGLANGRYSYSVNAVLVPAALEAITQLVEAGVVKNEGLARNAAAMAEVWTREAPSLFEAALPLDVAQRRVDDYADVLGVPTVAVQPDADDMVHFPALALAADGTPIRVMQSDPAFLLFFSEPSAARLDMIMQQTRQAFPAGLMTPVGMLVSNPVYAAADVQAIFTRGHYHGPVVWPWQQAMMAAGLDRQISREDLPQATKARLAAFRDALWAAIGNGHDVKTAELWSWEYTDGAYKAVPYGQGLQHLTESNAAQLWSTVYLAISPPE
ncbi:hypothetical protein [Kordiimonas lacus]|uniref:Lipoprotein n=1 Tax=Kordiimonas lacus TaxID=637679 RepID=A0A1G6ZQ24_9PROT|nr:hypothetical protein [Kordiimonas lacus]SDE03666.1 hypothetical protein SAMN04488071_1872 [Kordiimonas lacus]